MGRHKGCVVIHSEATKIKISKSLMGNQNCLGKQNALGYRHTDEALQKISEASKGKNNVGYIDGRSFEPYGIEFNEELREQIRKRDDYICRECDKTQEELDRKLDIHHIDYDKTNNKPENLISLCHSCHGKTGFGRDDWIEYFEDKMKGDYND